MSLRPFTGSFYLSGGRFVNVAGTLTATPVCSVAWACQGKPSPAPAHQAKAAAPAPDDSLDPSRIYAARAAAGGEASRNPQRTRPETDADPFTPGAAAAVYAARATRHN